MENPSDPATKDKPVTKLQNRTKGTPKRPKTENNSDVQGARPDGTNVKGRRGLLKTMTEIPLDTIHDIFRNLEPLDLLHLSWSSKRLRAVVMEKSARYIWQDVGSKYFPSADTPFAEELLVRLLKSYMHQITRLHVAPRILI